MPRSATKRKRTSEDEGGSSNNGDLVNTTGIIIEKGPLKTRGEVVIMEILSILQV